MKRRIFDPFSEFSGLVWFVPEFSMNLHIFLRPFRVGYSVIVSPLPCCGILIRSKLPLIIPGRRYRPPPCLSASPLRSEDIYRVKQANLSIQKELIRVTSNIVKLLV